ncbi:MAG: Mth938-like domain-containing protein [Gammaproteobacteria bacterium]|nr:Mth938-like domain-containing protein [Gammaproteobacteria bacterium]
MKFTLEAGRGAYYITAYRDGAVRIGQQEFAHSVIVTAGQLLEWPVTLIHDLTIEHLGGALQLQPDIIVLGTGSRLVFPPLALQAALAALRVGLEVMDTAAACRTYNVLLSEDRRVAAALMIEASD